MRLAHSLIYALSLPAVTLAAPFAFVPNTKSASVSVVDTASGAVVATVPTGGLPAGVAVDQGGRTAYVTNLTLGTVHLIDGKSHTLVDSIPVSTRVYGVAVNPAGTRLYVGNIIFGNNALSIIDLAARSVIATVPLAAAPQGIAVHPSGSAIYVALQLADSVVRVDAATNTVTGSLLVGDQPIGLAIDRTGRWLYCANIGTPDTVSVIDTASFSVAATIPVGHDAFGIAVNANGTRVVVSNYADNSASVIDATSRQVIATPAVGSQPIGVSFAPDGRHAYVANAGSHSVSVLDMVGNAVVATIQVGTAPEAFGQFIEPAGLPAAPSGLVATLLAPRRVELRWLDNASNETQVEIELRRGGGPFVPVKTLAPDITRAVIAGLAKNARYAARVRTRNASGVSEYSPRVAFVTPR